MIEEVVTDKGYHSRRTVHNLEALDIRTYISEPDRGRQSWTDQEAERDAVYANRRRIRGTRGKRLLRRRGELLERPSAHLYETGGLRRAHTRGHENVLKRAATLDALIAALCTLIDDLIAEIWSPPRSHTPSNLRSSHRRVSRMKIGTWTTGC